MNNKSITKNDIYKALVKNDYKNYLYKFLMNKIIKYCGVELHISESSSKYTLYEYIYELDKNIFLNYLKMEALEDIDTYLDIKKGKKINIFDIILKRDLNFKNGVPLIMKVKKATFIVMQPCENDDINLLIIGKYSYHILKDLKERMFDLYTKNNSLSVYHLKVIKDQAKYILTDKITSSYVEGLVLDNSQLSKVKSYIENSIRISDEMYNKFSIIKSIGIILYGIPGSGKSSYIKMLASLYGCEIVYVDYNNLTTSISSIVRRSKIKRQKYKNKRTFVIFEDVDIFIKKRDDAVKPEDRDVFSTLLQYLNGSMSSPYVINIATTNHLEKIDDAIIREGRFDLSIELNGMSKEQVGELCDKFNVQKNYIWNLIDDSEYPVLPAHCQSLIVQEYDKAKL